MCEQTEIELLRDKWFYEKLATLPDYLSHDEAAQKRCSEKVREISEELKASKG